MLIKDSAVLQNNSATGIDKSVANNGQDDERSDISAVDLSATTQPLSDGVNDPYESGSQSSGKDNADATLPPVWLSKMKQEEDPGDELAPPNLLSPKDNRLSGNPAVYPHCSSAPTLTVNSASSCSQSPKISIAAANTVGAVGIVPLSAAFTPRKDRRRIGGFVSLSGQPFPRLPDVEFSAKRIPELNSTTCPSKNWKVAHSDRLNALIDECERIVDGRKVFKCKFCGKMYDIKSSMRYHMKIIHLQLHLRTSEMQCRICGKQFTCISAVNRHQLKCSANSSSTFTSSHPIQSSCGPSYLGKPSQSPIHHTFGSLPSSSSAFMNLNAPQGLRWSTGGCGPTGGGRNSNTPINGQLPFSFPSSTETSTYLSPPVNSAFPGAHPRPTFDFECPRGGPDISPQQLGGSCLTHSVQNLVEGIPPLSFNEVLLASLGRTAANGAGSSDVRKPSIFDDLPPPPAGFLNSHGFLPPPPCKRPRRTELGAAPSFVNETFYERLLSAQNEAVAAAAVAAVAVKTTAANAAATVSATTTGGTAAIDLSLNAPC